VFAPFILNFILNLLFNLKWPSTIMEGHTIWIWTVR